MSLVTRPRSQPAQLCWAAAATGGNDPRVLRRVAALQRLGQAVPGNVNEARVQTQRVPDEEQTFTGLLNVTTVATG